MATQGQRKKENKARHKALTVLGVVLCIVLIPMLAINITLVVKSYLNTDKVPSVGGYLPMIILTDSMYPEIHGGDLIICQTADAASIKKGDIISFFDPAGSNSVVTHRVIKIEKKNGKIAYRTKGDANNAADQERVPAENLVGVYSKRIPGAGNAAMFLQTVPGLIICVICPLILLIGYDVVRRRRYEKRKQEDTNALLTELQALREGKSAAVSDESEQKGKHSDGA